MSSLPESRVRWDMGKEFFAEMGSWKMEETPLPQLDSYAGGGVMQGFSCTFPIPAVLSTRWGRDTTFSTCLAGNWLGVG